MFHLHDRRVRRLRLTATGEDRLGSARILLQDALYTASLPGLSGNRLTIIKQFKIGCFSTRQSSASLSALIDRQILDLSSRAVPAEHPNAASSPIVYFRDDIEPYVMLAVRLAANADISAWFWPLAVNNWLPAMSRSEGLRVVLFQLAGTRAGPAGVVSLVSELRRRDLLEPLLAALEKNDAVHLLQLTCGATLSDRRPAQELPSEAVVTGISSTALTALLQACQRWGCADVRAIWLATILMAEEKPARLLDALLVHRARALVDFVSRPLGLSPAKSPAAEGSSPITGNEQADDSRQSALPAEVNFPGRVQVAESSDQIPNVDAPSSSRYFTTDATQPKTRVIETPSVDSLEALSIKSSSQEVVEVATNASLENKSPSPDHGNIAADADGEALANDEPATDSFARETLQTPVLDSVSQSLNHGVDADVPDEAPVILRDHQDLSWPADAPDGGRRDSPVPPSLFETSEATASDGPQAQVQLSWSAALQWTDFGGFYFLLALMERLNLAEFLENHPQLIELDFPRRLLLFAADQISVPEADPVRALLQDVNDLPPQEIEFSAPAIWREQLYRSGALVWSPIAGRPGYRMMTDRSGRNVLATWRGEMPEGAQKLIGDSQSRVVNARQCKDDLKVLLAGWYRAMRRWGRGYAGLTLLDLIQRTGQIALTRTHVDLFFDLESADIRIRRAGLDVDPGWLPWLGRVVSFHYLDKEEFDGRE
ncbi:MAG TPA: hypothetical protein VHQ95_02570 [Pyrinomonadaceae bacterium]|nr:hypothetical protein [Pyrinomonadaceae bacterium]